MPQILIMNAGTAQMSGTDLTAIQLSLAAKSAWRSVWLAQEGDLIVSPIPIPADLLSFVGSTLKFDPASLLLFVPEGAHDHPVLCDVTLQSDAVVERISHIVRQNTHWKISACYATEGVARLAAVLGIAKDGGQVRSSARARPTESQEPLSSVGNECRPSVGQWMRSDELGRTPRSRYPPEV
ncbi:hypothetical protein MTX20_36965 [Bradyrhizobium sp. ISRA435]|nr:hypothetical protein MTX20_36965 [Bradyrhizobium sp. ISRA435]